MKKSILLLAISLFSFSTLMTVSCKKETEKVVEQSLEEKLSVDARFKTAIEAATSMATSFNVESLSNPQNIEALKNIATKINNKTATAADYDKVQQIAGVSYNDLIGSLARYNTALSELNNAYPELASMSQDQVAAIVTKSIKANNQLNKMVASPAVIGEFAKAACPLQDVCKLAVTLTNLFAGNAICAAIGISIPVIGDIVCKLILTLGVGILNGICGALPC